MTIDQGVPRFRAGRMRAWVIPRLAPLVAVCALGAVVAPAANAQVTAAAPTFSKPEVLSAFSHDFVEDVVTGDFTGNGLDDIAVLGQRSEIAIFLSNGYGMFYEAPGSPFSLATDGSSGDGFNSGLSGSQALAVGDFTGDGLDDLAVAGLDSDNDADVVVLRSNGDGTFSPASGSPLSFDDAGLAAKAIAVNDFNGDGILDLAVTTGNQGSTGTELATYLGNGDGTFSAAPGSPMALSANSNNAYGSNSIAVGDFGNGEQDLAIANFNSDNVEILSGNGTGGFTASSFISIEDPNSVIAGDFNGPSNLPDLAVTGFVSGGDATILDATGPETFAAGQSLANPAPDTGLASVDLNDDGIPDLVGTFSGDLAEGGGVSVYNGLGNGTFGVGNGANVFLPVTDSEHVAVGDFTGNGVQGIVANHSVENVSGAVGTVEVYLNTSKPSVSLSPSELQFAATTIGSASSSQAVVVSNNGAAPLAISGVAIGADDGTATDADQFALSADSCSGQTIAAGSSCTIGVRYKPSVTGSMSADLQVASNAPTGVAALSLSGTGLAAPSTTGPAGPAGPAGPTGPSGRNGTNGTNGASPTGSSSKCTSKTKKGTTTTTCKVTYTYGTGKKGNLVNGERAEATARIKGKTTIVARGEVRDHKLVLTFTHLKRGRYQLTLVEFGAHGHHKTIGHTSLVIS
jgi:VCBS repeat protein/HYDIN/CFA65/VesB family protein